MKIDKSKFVDILQARREFRELKGTKNRNTKTMRAFRNNALKFLQDNKIEHYLIPHDSTIGKRAELYIPKEYVSVFLRNKDGKKIGKVSKYESLTINTTGKSFTETLKELGITHACFMRRIHEKWSFGRAITTPHKDLQETEYKAKIKRDLDKFMIRKRNMKYRQH